MRAFPPFVLLLALAESVALAGPLFDDYLNYARLGEHCWGDSGEVTLGEDKPIGQTFKVAAGTGEIYRIGVWANSEPDSWGDGEVVTMTLYDSPSRRRKLGSYSIDWQTCRIRPLAGQEKPPVRVLLFPMRAKMSGQSSLYFELTVKGGDGRVRFHKASVYAGGEGYQGGEPQSWDLFFETHIKPAADRVANLKAFWEKINLDLPALAAVKAAVQAGDYDRAEEEFVRHFRERTDLWDPKLFKPEIKPDFYREFADLLAAGKLWKSKDGKVAEVIPWRKESYWAPDYVKWGKEYEPDITGNWHIERTLLSAYSATGEEKYARAGIDLRMQFVLDNNPSPRVTGIRAPHDIWNELTAGRGRAPGHLPYIYSRVHDYPGMTTDEWMVLFCSWYDNADYLYRSSVGGNWGFQAANSCYSFGKDFPEYRKSADFMSWGSQRITELTLETVRGDGTQHEAAIKYHAMCARRLKSLMADYQQGTIKLDESFVPELRRNLEGMYEHMAYVLQPDKHVVMCGDAWYEDYSAEVAEAGKMVKRPDLVWIATQGKEGTPPKEISKIFPDGGYFIMRSDFGGPGKVFTDARQAFVHNGGWVGSHGHFDLLSIALYGYGRTLLIDPGGMWEPPLEQVWWKSDIHSMLVPDGRDCSRDPGDTRWVSASGFDYLDGFHTGYSKVGVPETRRRIVFLKPDYFVVDDSAPGKDERQWDQVWNILDNNAKVDDSTKAAETTYPSGGNLIVWPLVGGDFEVVRRPLKFPMDGVAESTIIYYRTRTANPRFTTVLYPYRGARPRLQVSKIAPDGSHPDVVTAVRVMNGGSVDLVAWGDLGQGAVTFSGGKHVLDGKMMAVRTTGGRTVNRFSWYQAKRAVFNGRELARSANPVAALDVAYSATGVSIESREPDPSLVVWVGNAKTVTVNGKKLAAAKTAKGYVRPFPSATAAVVLDDDSPNFRRITQTNEWQTVAEPRAYAYAYTAHETDPGRHEAGAYTALIPATGSYRLEVFVPKTTRTGTDTMEYAVQAAKGEACTPASAEGIVKQVNADRASGRYTVVVDQQKAAGRWVDLGVYYFVAGRREFLTATNRTETDGLWPTFDAVRLTAR